VGYVKFVDDFKMTIADIPGIIEDAHKDKGLGF
jgi:GTPase involved in cell partitioning and DNA repair